MRNRSSIKVLESSLILKPVQMIKPYLLMKTQNDARSVNMKLMIQKWDNSAAIKLPESMLEQLGAKIGDCIEVDVQANTLTLRPARPRYKLADLLGQTTGSFPVVDGWDEMSSVGKEIF